ncbi:MAG: hypothetical protein EXS52_02350 [Candidatus Staskawiczbacteria bacterium]|nr:hypothetical protein [Candidatus Staskawiczbacteria bacterium]
MEPKKHNIANDTKPSPKIWRWFFFVIGIIATVAYRIIFLLDPFWIEVAWYTGTIGFMLYFGHRAIIEAKRAKIVKDYQLIETLEKSSIGNDEKTALLYLTKTSLTSKARFNSAFIFFASVIVFIMNFAIDIYHFFV